MFVDALLDFFRPLIDKIGNWYFPYTRKKITGKHYYSWRDDILPGTIFLTNTLGEISNYFNPSKLKHGAIYIGGDKIKYVIEATGKGVTKTDLVSFLTSKDVVVAVRPNFASVAEMDEAAKKAEDLIGRPYDLEFEPDNYAIYCFELLVESYKSIFPQVKFKMESRLGYDYYSSSTFLDDVINWKIIIDSRSKCHG